MTRPPRVGAEFEDAHYPGRAPIEAYGNGGFRFGGMSHRGSIIVLPSGIRAWAADPAEPFLDISLAPVFAEADAIDILLIGTGEALLPIPEALRQRLRSARISGDSMATGPAVRTYNVLLSENRAVAAALIAVEEALRPR